MLLNEILGEAKQQFKSRVPEHAQAEIFGLIHEQQQSGKVYGLREGHQAPDFTLPSTTGVAVNLVEQLAKGPVVLTFYRGGWCPYCNLQLRAYQSILPEIEALGGRLIALSPQNPENTLSQQEKEDLNFHVFSDPNGKVASLYDILFELPTSLQEVMLHTLKLDLLDYNAANRWILPIPSTFIIDRSGIIRFTYVNPDFMQRLEPQVILEQLKNL
ncbi:peroxiredoxin-like family protein [Paenibacillus lupini]|uniref:peroxiredoxin-like family protein n=1 Tax=Paenibacillus lupini TaxID=1450204 RepID=UPI00141DDF3B|nr:peroxiredoxin-like family protein [Paenibacillus lupini]NIK26089.1 peroxiredoxin [Paenibacillus lupini]